MRIKKYENNEFIWSGNIWVRNFTKKNVVPVGASNLYYRDDYELTIVNQERNKKHLKISDENLSFDKIVIVSDGFDFEKKHQILGSIPKDVSIFAVNKALRKWQLTKNVENRRFINAYVVNNPYNECLSYLPSKELQYYPTCISSLKTNHNFLSKYKGKIYTYYPTLDKGFGYENVHKYFIDDYRNPICAAIGLACQFGVKKLMLVSCDDSFAEKREYAIQLKNGLWTYPQQLISHNIIDATLYWLTSQEDHEVKVANFSDGEDYKHAAYISKEEEVRQFFMDEEIK